MKVFCIGFQKTGTTSLEAALKLLRYRVCDVRFDLIQPLRQRDFSKVWEIADAYDAVRDNPWPVLFRELDKQYPGSKFILSIRDESAWIKSVVNHFGTKPSEMLDFIYGFPFPIGHEETFLQTYRNHNRDVREYFADREDDLLVLDLNKEAGWVPLCSFLQRPVPSVAFPHQNKGAYSYPEKFFKKTLKRIKAKIRSFRNR
jgi:hypothetical protein